MENGSVYSPTTEEDPGPARGGRGGLAACFFPGRLPLYRRLLKGSQLDFYITLGTGCVFLLASTIFVSTHDRTSAEIAAIAFGFMASIMFLVDFAVMLYTKRQESQLRKPESSTRAEALTEPLNA
ncbi:CKLF-like MARVEL transmembrane domain-containing protein 6 isoform 2-T2 [Ctenodactylus gundi]